jgi:hypothetical protein
MISDERERERSRRTLVWAVLISALLHVALAPLASWVWLANWVLVPKKSLQTETVVASTSVRIERRSVAQPPVRGASPQRAAPPQPAPHPAVRRERAAPRYELARSMPSATPQPTPSPEKKRDLPQPLTLRERLVEQQRRFAEQVAQLNRRKDPLSLAPVPRQPPAAFHRAFFDVPGHRERDVVQIVLTPLRHWYSGGTICYYARYDAQHGRGGSEDGVIPWPVCYPIGDDRIANPPYVHSVPIPVPPPGYVLPAGTYLTPLLQGIYNEKAGR